MKRYIVGIVALGALVGTPALGADLPLPMKAPPPVIEGWNWAGSYFGAYGGGGWGTTRQTDTSGATTGDYRQSGGVFGGTYGIQGQAGNIVFGEESDYGWSGIKGTVSPAPCVSGSCFTNLQTLGTTRVRLGYAWDRYMVYGTAGFAFGSVNAGQDSCAGGGFTICGTATNYGWAAGGGVEAFIAPMWSVKVEYLHFDLNKFPVYTVVIPVNVSERGDVVRAGINYHFNLLAWLGMAH
jgi:outer membrane immunogenic protein